MPMEVAGLAVGVVALAGLFNNAVDCFEYVQLGRSFQQDYTTCVLQLDCARLQLSRWGQSVGIGQDLQNNSTPQVSMTDEDVRTAQKLLDRVIVLFDLAKASAERYNIQTKHRGQELAIHEAADSNSAMDRLHQKMRNLSLSR